MSFNGPVPGGEVQTFKVWCGDGTPRVVVEQVLKSCAAISCFALAALNVAEMLINHERFSEAAKFWFNVIDGSEMSLAIIGGVLFNTCSLGIRCGNDRVDCCTKKADKEWHRTLVAASTALVGLCAILNGVELYLESQKWACPPSTFRAVELYRRIDIAESAISWGSALSCTLPSCCLESMQVCRSPEETVARSEGAPAWWDTGGVERANDIVRQLGGAREPERADAGEAPLEDIGVSDGSV